MISIRSFSVIRTKRSGIEGGFPWFEVETCNLHVTVIVVVVTDIWTKKSNYISLAKGSSPPSFPSSLGNAMHIFAVGGGTAAAGGHFNPCWWNHHHLTSEASLKRICNAFKPSSTFLLRHELPPQSLRPNRAWEFESRKELSDLYLYLCIENVCVVYVGRLFVLVCVFGINLPSMTSSWGLNWIWHEIRMLVEFFDKKNTGFPHHDYIFCRIPPYLPT